MKTRGNPSGPGAITMPHLQRPDIRMQPVSCHHAQDPFAQGLGPYTEIPVNMESLTSRKQRASQWLRGRIFCHRTGDASIRTRRLGACAQTLIDIRKWWSVELQRKEFRDSGCGSNGDGGSVSSGVRHAAGCTGACVTSASFGCYRMVRAEHLISEAVRAAWRRAR